jgi:hypothetical protein
MNNAHIQKLKKNIIPYVAKMGIKDGKKRRRRGEEN